MADGDKNNETVGASGTTQAPVIIKTEGAFTAGIRLNNKNYNLWSQVMEMQIAGREKLSYIRGQVEPPHPTAEGFEQWYAENQKVKGWLLSSMPEELMKRFIRLPTAKQVWDAVATAFYDDEDEVEVFALHQQAFKARQAGRSVSEYFGEMSEIFQELDHRSKVVMQCAADEKVYHESIDRLRVHIFLAGLDETFEQVRGEVLRREMMPTLEECFAFIRREDTRRTTMKHDTQDEEVSAMLAKTKLKSSRWPDKGQLKCTHCDGEGHTKERCYELVGYPDWWDHSRSTKKKVKRTMPVVAAVTTQEQSISERSEALATLADNPGKFSRTFDLNNHWIIDSACTDHVTRGSDYVHNVKPSTQETIATANGSKASIVGEGSIPLTRTLTLDRVFVVPTLNHNLLSVAQLTKTLMCVISFWPDYCVFTDIQTRKKIGYGIRKAGLYYLELEQDRTNHLRQALSVESSKEEEAWLWHRRLGHSSFHYLKKLFPVMFKHLDMSKFRCETCALAKGHRNSFPLRMNKSLFPFAIIHSDVWGPSKILTFGKYRWFVTFIDDYSRMTWLWLMKSKDEVADLFVKFHRLIKTQYQRDIKVLRSDNGGEYMSHQLQKYLATNGIVHETTCVYTPQQNGIAERKNRHLLEVVRAVLIDARMPLTFWGEAMAFATASINRTPSSSLGFATPLQTILTTNGEVERSNLTPRTFGCIAYVYVQKPLQCSKLEPRALKCVFVGYGHHQKGYRCYHPPTKHTYVTMDVSFHETVMYYATETASQGEKKAFDIQSLAYNEEDIRTLDYQSGNGMEHPNEVQEETQGPNVNDRESPSVNDREVLAENIQDLTSNEDEDGGESDQNSPSITDQGRQLPSRITRGVPRQMYEPTLTSSAKYPIANYVSNMNMSESNIVFTNQLSTVVIPNNVQEAMKDPKWREAMNEEMKSLEKNETWDLVECPTKKRLVGCRWVYTVKYKADGKVERYKARLVAKGYTQAYGVDYTETFAPVAKINTVRVLLSVAANKDWTLQQFDVKNAFLHGELKEEIYMELPPGSMVPNKHCHKVCKLKKSLYGLKQSPRAWFGRFTKSMKDFGYSQSNRDHTLFLKRKGSKVTALIVYVDDMIVTGNDEVERRALQKHLSNEFEMKDLGSLKYFLGIEVSRSKKGIFLSQRKYALDLLCETGMLNCKPTNTPLIERLKLGVDPGQTPVDKGRYQRLVGRLMYLAHTRPDLAYPLSVVSQFMQNPGAQHMEAVMHILRYIKGAPGKGLMFRRSDAASEIQVYTDADWAGSKSDRRSTAGYFSFVGGNLVTWRSKKQKRVSRSSAEAELRGMALGVCEGMWLQLLLRDLGCASKCSVRVYCDNKAARDIAHNPVHHDRMKHVDIDRFFIKEQLDEGALELPVIKSEDQLADILTKPVSCKSLSSVCVKLGMDDIHAPA